MRISKMIFTFCLVQASHIKQTESEILRIYNIYASCGLSQGIICKKDGDGRHFMCTLYIISLTLWCREEVVIRFFCLQSSNFKCRACCIVVCLLFIWGSWSLASNKCRFFYSLAAGWSVIRHYIGLQAWLINLIFIWLLEPSYFVLILNAFCFRLS